MSAWIYPSSLPDTGDSTAPFQSNCSTHPTFPSFSRCIKVNYRKKGKFYYERFSPLLLPEEGIKFFCGPDYQLKKFLNLATFLPGSLPLKRYIYFDFPNFVYFSMRSCPTCTWSRKWCRSSSPETSLSAFSESGVMPEAAVPTPSEVNTVLII